MNKEMHVTDLKDIKRLRVECGNNDCGEVLVISINDTNKIPSECPSCHTKIDHTIKRNEIRNYLINFFELLSGIKDYDDFTFSIESEKEKSP